MQNRILCITDEGQKFWATKEQADAIETLSACRKGGLARVYGYVSKTGCVDGQYPLTDYTVLTRFSLFGLYERKIDQLNAIQYDDVADAVAKDPKLSVLPTAKLKTIFEERKAMEIASLQKTLDGVRDDARRQSHDRNYGRVADGVKVHFKTVKIGKGADAETHPELLDGFPVCESIMLTCLEIAKDVRREGVYKVVNSGEPVRMSNCIAGLLNKRSVGLKTLSLKEDNFERLTIDRQTVIPEDIQPSLVGLLLG